MCEMVGCCVGALLHYHKDSLNGRFNGLILNYGIKALYGGRMAMVSTSN